MIATFLAIVLLPFVWDGACLAQSGPILSVQSVDASQLRIAWPDSGESFELESATALDASAQWTPHGQVPSLSNGTLSVTVTVSAAPQFFRLRQIPLTYLQSTSPLHLEPNVSVTRETVVHFSAPLGIASVIKPDNFYAGIGGRRILSRTQLSSDRRSVTLFYLEPLPGSARVTAVFDGTGLVDQSGKPLDADGDGVAGGMAVFSFDTLGLTPLAGTAVVGTIYASELMPGTDTGTNAVNRPLEGVTITVDGMEESLRTRTDALGRFKLEPVPPGKFFVHIDGRTAKGSTWPAGDYYPTVGKQWEATPGRVDTLAGGTGQIFLPLIKAGALQSVSTTQDTTITFLPEIVRQNPALAGVSMTVPANALFSENGTRGGKVGIAAVPPDRLPGPLPAGLEMPIVITVQTDGALNFDRPAPICFPNLPDPVLKAPLPAGSKQALISFNHDKGVWEAVGSMTVSADGTLICTDPGSGILQPGWHGVGPNPTTPPPPNSCPINNADDEPPLLTTISRRNAGLMANSGTGCRPDCQDTFVNSKSCEALCTSLLSDCKRKHDQLFHREFYRCGAVFKNSPDKRDLCTKMAVDKVNFLNFKCFDRYYECLKACDVCAAASHSKSRSSLPQKTQTLETDTLIWSKLGDIRVKIETLLNTVPIPADREAQLQALQEQAVSIAGGDPVEFLERMIADDEERNADAAQRIGAAPEDLEPFSQPPYPILYAATIDRPTGTFILRGETLPLGQYSLFIPRDGKLLDVSFYDPRTRQFGFLLPNRSTKARYPLPRFFISPIPTDTLDSDGDGAVDLVEEVYGTDPGVMDSDGDGIYDGAEIHQGTNPLDGQPIRTGIIGTVKTPGAAVDVAAANQYLAVAQGTGGVSVFTLDGFESPRLIATLTALGNAQRVAASGDTIAVAGGESGLHIIDARATPSPRVVWSLKKPGAQAIAAENGIAYAGFASGLIVALDMANGRVVNEVHLTNAVWDVTLSGDHLYALTDDRLFAISMAGGGFSIAGSIGVPFEITPNRRLFVGGGLAYTVHGRGYNSIDITDPTRPVLLTTGRTAQLGWKDLADSGSGTAVAAVGISPASEADVSLYDFSDPKKNDQFLTQFPTPGTASAVAIHRGFAHVADGTGGLQIVNYLPFDTRKQPPTITLSSSAVLGVAESLQPLRVTANAVDDVQIRQVEFYLNGQRTFVDGNFPFEYRVNLTAPTGGNSQMVVRARAVDTGGNATWSDELKLQLGPDITPPRVIGTSPLGGDKVVSQVLAAFSEPINSATLNSGTFRLIASGPDGRFDTADDQPIENGTVQYQAETLTASLSFASPLPVGLYRALVTADVADVTGNRLTEAGPWNFRVADAVFWIGSDNGSWSDGANWSTGSVPGPNDDVILENLPASITVSHIEGTTRIRNLKTDLPLQISGGSTFQVDGVMELQAPLLLNNGTLKNSHVLQTADARLQPAPNAANTLDGVRITGDLVLTNTSTRVSVRNGLELSGTVVLDNASAITFAGNQTFDAGSILFAGSVASLNIEPGTALTLGPDTIVRGKFGILQASAFGAAKLINQGRIAADIPGGVITLAVSQLENQGTLTAQDGASINLLEINSLNAGTIDIQPGGTFTWNGSWTNQGTLRLNDGTLNLGGTVTLPRLGNLTRTGGTLNLNGTLELGGGTLALDASTGPWRIERGTLHNGTLTQSAEARLLFAPNAPNTLDAMRITGDLVLTNTSARAIVRNGLELAGTVVLDNASAITFAGNQTFNTGSILFAGSIGLLNIEPGTTMTLGPDMIVRGKSGILQASAFGTTKLINQGRIAADSPGGVITLAVSHFENQGTLTARDGASINFLEIDSLNAGTIDIQPGGTFTWNGSWTNQGTLRLNDGTLNLGGTVTLPRLGNLTRTGGTLNLNGTLELGGGTLALDASTGSWRIERGTLRNGTLTQSAEARLLFAPNAPNTLDAMRITGDLVLTNTSARAIVRNGLELSGTVVLDNSSAITFAGSQTFNTGSILFSSGFAVLNIEPGTTLTLGPDMIVRGKFGNIQPSAFGTVKLINQGQIVAEGPGGILTINPTQFENTGLLRADGAGTTLRILTPSFVNTGTIQELNGGKVVSP